MSELPKVVAQTSIDKAVDVVLWRKGQQHVVKLTVAELRDDGEKQVATAKAPASIKQEVKKSELKDLGVTVVEISDAAREKYTIPDSVRGLIVVSVDQLSDAALKGVRPGDVIDEIQQMRIGNVSDADTAIHRAHDASLKVVLLRVISSGALRYVPVKMAS
jgi:serine protease Do